MGIDAGGSEFQHYSSGVYNNPNCNADKINHGVSSSSIIITYAYVICTYDVTLGLGSGKQKPEFLVAPP